jgi:hypothetical protein
MSSKKPSIVDIPKLHLSQVNNSETQYPPKVNRVAYYGKTLIDGPIIIKDISDSLARYSTRII